MQAERTIIITGCSSGIGAHCAKRLKEDGWRVFATARKPEDIEELRLAGFDAFYLDYREPASIKRCFDDVMKITGGRLDALFNNGAYSQAGAVEDMPIEALREQFDANFFGWHELTLVCVPVMRRQGFGRIIQHSSVLGIVPAPMRGAYNASKYAIEGLFLTMGMELEGSGVFVSLIETGPIPSKIAQNAVPYFEKYIDMENSYHAEDYARRMKQLRAGGTPDKSGNGAEPVYKKLKRALDDKTPHRHYFVTLPTHVSGLMKRFLPSSLLYKILNAWS
ncbi:MAG: SDR family oxidoreductase [Pseudomonadota bacterium]